MSNAEEREFQVMERGMAMLSDKLDTPEKVSAVFELMGEDCSSMTEENWTKGRDNLRKKHGHFVVIDVIRSAAVEQDEHLHVSKCKTMVAYAQNIEKRRADVWTATKFGRYLTKYHPNMSNEDVKKAVTDFDYAHSMPPTVKFGDTEEDFIRAIKDGPSESCMSDAFYGNSGGEFKYAGHVHPAAVYAAGDIEVAWLEFDGRITARALCAKATKKYSRVYGDAAKLHPQLEALGYESEKKALVGCRLRKIEDERGDGHIMCYVDAGTGSGGGALGVEHMGGDHWLLVDGNWQLRGGSYRLVSGRGDVYTYDGYDLRGVTGDESARDAEDTVFCDRCGDAVDEYEGTTYIEDESQSVCENCLDQHYAHAQVSYRGAMEWMLSDETTYVSCLGRRVSDDLLSELDEITYDDEMGEYVMTDRTRMCVDDVSYHRDNCIAVGTDSGGDIFIHENHVDREKRIGHLYMNADGEMFWHKSDEIVEWLDAEGEEGWDPVQYVEEEVKYVEEEVKYVEEEVVLNVDAWRAAYLTMQSEGIKFRHNGSWISELAFSSPQSCYTIDLTQDFPKRWLLETYLTWQDTYLKAQAAGVKFVALQMAGQNEGKWLTPKELGLDKLLFDGHPTSYQLEPIIGDEA